MFVIAGHVEERTPSISNWDELRRMARSGRWDIQEHAGVQHVNVPYDKDGHTGPAYSYRRMLGQWPSSRPSRRTAARVSGDILWAKQHAVASSFPVSRPWAFAVPFGELRQRQHERPADPGLSCDGFLGRHFQAVFLT